MGPESIPRSLLQVDCEILCIDKVGLLANIDRSALYYFIFRLTCGTHNDINNRLKDAKSELLDSALIRINAETGFIAIHRVLQSVYFFRMLPDLRISAFEDALGLLRAQYPSKSRSLTGHLYAKWAQCNTWHHQFSPYEPDMSPGKRCRHSSPKSQRT
jgi:hypothetical protein